MSKKNVKTAGTVVNKVETANTNIEVANTVNAPEETTSEEPAKEEVPVEMTESEMAELEAIASTLGINPADLTETQKVNARRLIGNMAKKKRGPVSKEDATAQKIDEKVKTITRLRDQISNNAYWLKQWGVEEETLTALTSAMEVKQIQVRTMARKAKEAALNSTTEVVETPIEETPEA